ncbi:MAG: hypothetical protein PHV66_06280, partial [Bacteroidales bacterium]|nr:hypothetical protein [Bacteroidales bacterium]
KAELDNRCLQPPLSAAIATLVASQPFNYRCVAASIFASLNDRFQNNRFACCCVTLLASICQYVKQTAVIL